MVSYKRELYSKQHRDLTYNIGLLINGSCPRLIFGMPGRCIVADKYRPVLAASNDLHQVISNSRSSYKIIQCNDMMTLNSILYRNTMT